MTRIGCVAAAFVVSCLGIAQAQVLPPRDNTTAAPRTGTARLQGRVVAADSGQPLRRVQVALFSVDGSVRRVVTTDPEGRYEFAEVPAGRYTLSASKTGFVTLQLGQRRPFEPGRPINVADDQRISQLDFALPKGSVIAGRITDEFGEAIAGASIQAQRYEFAPGGERKLTYASQGAVTDDLGQFRLFGLAPAEYVVIATELQGGLVVVTQTNARASDTTERYVPTYYPGTANPDDAQTIRVGLAQEVPLAFSLVAARTSQVSGIVTNSRGQFAAGASLNLAVNSDDPNSRVIGGRVVGTDGTFTIGNVPPGSHSIQVRTIGDGPTEAVVYPITVAGKNIEGLQVRTLPPATISGTVVFEGTADRRGNAPIRVVTIPATTRSRYYGIIDQTFNGRMDDQGRFEIRGQFDRVLLRATAPTAWTLKAVTLDGEDITDTPLNLTDGRTLTGLRVVLTDRMTDIRGRVTGERGDPIKEYVVVIEPSEPMQGMAATRFIRTARPDQDGRFDVKALPPGRYVAIALETLEIGREWDPEFQQRLRDAGRGFDLEEGESVTLDLKLSTVPY